MDVYKMQEPVPEVKLLRPDLESLLLTPAALLAGQSQASAVSIMTCIIVACGVVLLAFLWGAKVFLTVTLVIGIFGVFYWLLYREVKRRGLSDNFVIFGFTPVTIIPCLLYVLALPDKQKQAEPGSTGFETVNNSALENMGVVWSVALLGWIPFPPFVMNITYMASSQVCDSA